MKLTNKLNLPQPIVDAVANDPYSRGAADISVTQLISPPRLIALAEAHREELEEDASDRIFSLLGQAVHTILERANTSAIAEKRLFLKYGDWTVSGAFDRLSLLQGGGIQGHLQDYKVGSVWEVIHGVKKEREQQLNLLRLLCEENGYRVTRLTAIFILRDWKKSEAERNRLTYPQRQIAQLDLPLWTMATARRFLADRVAAHKAARVELPACTPDDTWQRGTKYALKKPGVKRAVIVADEMSGLLAAMVAKKLPAFTLGGDLPKGYEIEKRPGDMIRCRHYCPVGGSTGICTQWNEAKEELNAASQPVEQ